MPTWELLRTCGNTQLEGGYSLQGGRALEGMWQMRGKHVVVVVATLVGLWTECGEDSDRDEAGFTTVAGPAARGPSDDLGDEEMTTGDEDDDAMTTGFDDAEPAGDDADTEPMPGGDDGGQPPPPANDGGATTPAAPLRRPTIATCKRPTRAKRVPATTA